MHLSADDPLLFARHDERMPLIPCAYVPEGMQVEDPYPFTPSTEDTTDTPTAPIAGPVCVVFGLTSFGCTAELRGVVYSCCGAAACVATLPRKVTAC